MIEIDNNRLYLDGVFLCYAEHSIHNPINSDCYLSFSHRYGRTLILVNGKAWLGCSDGSLPNPDIVIGSVIGPNGLLPDFSTMERLINYLQDKEDLGINVKIKVN